jgi:hypothetical protein
MKVEVLVSREIGDRENDQILGELKFVFEQDPDVTGATVEPETIRGPCLLFIDKIAFETMSSENVALSDQKLQAESKGKFLVDALVYDIVNSCIHELLHYLSEEEEKRFTPDNYIEADYSKWHRKIFRSAQHLASVGRKFHHFRHEKF